MTTISAELLTAIAQAVAAALSQQQASPKANNTQSVNGAAPKATQADRRRQSRRRGRRWRPRSRRRRGLRPSPSSTSSRAVAAFAAALFCVRRFPCASQIALRARKAPQSHHFPGHTISLPLMPAEISPRPSFFSALAARASDRAVAAGRGPGDATATTPSAEPC
jgi:hypothetical protein